MPEGGNEQARPRTWRPAALWTLGMLLVLGLAWFVGAVVVPVWQVRQELPIITRVIYPRGTVDHFFSNSVDRLGGPEVAARKLALYAGLPRFVAPRRAEAAALLGACDESSIGCLSRLLKDDDPKVREWAAASLAMPKAAQTVTPLLIGALRDHDLNVRRQACSALGRLGPAARDAIPEITKLLRDGNTRSWACVALGHMGPEASSVVPELAELLTHNDEHARFVAAIALGDIGPAAKAAVPSLKRLADDTKEGGSVRKAAAAALETIGGGEESASPADFFDWGARGALKSIGVDREPISVEHIDAGYNMLLVEIPSLNPEVPNLKVHFSQPPRSGWVLVRPSREEVKDWLARSGTK